MSKDTRNVPALRFKGFSDAWEKRCLKEILSVNSGRDYKHLLPGKVPVYGTGGYMLSVNEALSHSDAIGIGRKGTIDRPFFLKAPFWTVDTLFFLTVKKEMVLSFVFPLLQTIRWKQLDESTGVPSLSKKTIESIMVHVPQKEEQQIIGNTFILIDNLIAATQDKLDSIEKIKKALLQHLFDQSMRFKGYSDPWEKRKLGEVADIRGGGTPSTSKPEYWDGEIDWYAPAEIGTQRYVSGSRRQITKLGLNKSSATMLPANKTILFTSRAGIGNAAILTNSGATNQGFQSIVVKPATDVYFLYSEIPEIKRKAIRLAAGSTFIEISGKSLTKIQIRLPSFKEQSRIGHLFLQIDNLIDATQSKLSSLETLKKALLQGLFI